LFFRKISICCYYTFSYMCINLWVTWIFIVISWPCSFQDRDILLILEMIFTYLWLKGIDTSFQQRSAKAKDRDTFILHQFFLTYSLHQITNFVFMKTTLGINQYHRSMPLSFIWRKYFCVVNSQYQTSSLNAWDMFQSKCMHYWVHSILISSHLQQWSSKFLFIYFSTER
jgi:hypothetical protein